MRVLLSGFEVFGPNLENPTEKLIQSFNKNEIPYSPSLKVHALVLPVSFENAYPMLKKIVDEINPDVVISFGLAANRRTIDIESTALNIMGAHPASVKIIPNGEDAYASSLPVTGIISALKKAGLPVEESYSAGHYVCNHLFYNLMKDNQDTLRLCGFIHVPSEDNLKFSDLQKMLFVILKHLEY